MNKTDFLKTVNRSVNKKFLLFFLIFLIFLRIDFRTTIPTDSDIGDDASYYFHNKTLSYDFDLNYENQVSSEYQGSVNIKTKRPVPVHPFGSTIISSGLMFIGKLLENILGIKYLHYFFYSFSSIFFLFLSFYYLVKTLETNYPLSIKEKRFAALYFFGSGLIYYSFERFSLTHIYEVFGITVLFNLVQKTTTNKTTFSGLNIFLIGFLIFIFLSVRWTNYLLFLTPVFFLLISNKKQYIKALYMNPFLYFGKFIGCLAFCAHSYFLYGFITFNPGKIYEVSNEKFNELSNFVNPVNLLTNFDTLLINAIKVIFSSEFGLVFITPVIPFSMYLITAGLLKKEYSKFFITLLIYSVPFGLVLFWQTTASSFGFRYLLVLVPFSILIIFSSDFKISNYFFVVLKYLSIFSILCYLFFETNELTILSENYNTFNRFHQYSAPDFTYGVIQSILVFSSYLKIIFTSYLGVFFIKTLLIATSEQYLSEVIDQRGYLDDNVMSLLTYSQNITIIHFFICLIFSIMCFKILIKSTE
jgi:hypothetical protein